MSQQKLYKLGVITPPPLPPLRFEEMKFHPKLEEKKHFLSMTYD